MTKLLRPCEGETVGLLTAKQRSFTARGKTAPIDWLHLEKTDAADYTIPGKVEFAWETDRETSVVELSENGEFTDAKRFEVPGHTLSVCNLKMNANYYWRVNGCGTGFFKTEDAAPRWIEVNGISNVRDMGAWRTMDGRRVRQGLIFRGGEMDTHQFITEEGVRVLRDDLHIRTDLDIRGEAVGQVHESPLGKEVRFLLIPVRAYGEFFEEDQKAVCRNIFRVFADREKYPIYFHCWGGADRTGTIALLLEAILGVSEEDMLTDYELTSLSVWGDRSRESDLFRTLLAALDLYATAEDSMNQKAEKFLFACGITPEELENIRNIMLEM